MAALRRPTAHPVMAQVRQTVRHTLRNGLPDVVQCLHGRCIGRLCPCLCHTSLKLSHEAIAMRLDRRPDGRRQRRQGRSAGTNDPLGQLSTIATRQVNPRVQPEAGTAVRANRARTFR